MKKVLRWIVVLVGIAGLVAIFRFEPSMEQQDYDECVDRGFVPLGAQAKGGMDVKEYCKADAAIKQAEREGRVPR